MGNELTRTAQSHAVAGSGMRSSNVTTTLASSIPEWVDLPALDGSDLYGYGHKLPDGAATALVAAAHEHQIAMAPAAPIDVDRILRGLRTSTILQNEDGLEAEATMRSLRVHLSDVPLDILQDGCRAYCNAPGRRFFPKSAGELRTFINPLMHRRAARAFRLERLAKQAHEEQAERDRLAADPCTPEGVAAVLAEFGFRSSTPRAAAAPERREPTIEDYMQLGAGMSREDAEAALTERRRLLARTSAKTIGYGAVAVSVAANGLHAASWRS